MRCWDESPLVRPTAENLLHCLRDASSAWVPSAEYPIPDDPDGEAGSNFVSRDERIMATDAQTSFFTLLVAMLCAFVLLIVEVVAVLT